MSNEEKKENTFNKKVIYDEKGDFEIMENGKANVENLKSKKTLGEKLGKKAEEDKAASTSTGATPLNLTPKAASTAPLEELDLKNPTAKAATTEPPKPEIKSEQKAEPAKPEPKPEVKTEPAKPEPKVEPPKVELKPEPKPESKAESDKAEQKSEPPKPESKPEPKAEPPKVELKPEPKSESKAESDKAEQKSEPSKPEPKPEPKAEPTETGGLKKLNLETPKPVEQPKTEPESKTEPPKADGLNKLNLDSKPAEPPKAEEAPKAEPPKVEPKKETISPFELHPLAELCGKFSYSDSGFIEAVRRNLSLLATNPQERFYAENYKALIIHGARLLDDNGNLLIHIETAEHGHAIVKVTSSGCQDCTGRMVAGDIIMANVSGKELCICSMAFSPKLRFMK